MMSEDFFGGENFVSDEQNVWNENPVLVVCHPCKMHACLLNAGLYHARSNLVFETRNIIFLRTLY